MPVSSSFGKRYTLMMVKKLHDLGGIKRIVDFGCGEGLYHKIMQPHLPDVHWTGVEIWEPYVDQFQLRDKYDRIVLADCRTIDWADLGAVDLAIFGDILEHMTQEEAAAVVTRALAVASYVVISIPVVHLPQDAQHGNPYEVHVKDDWDHYQVMRTFSGISAFLIHDFIGVYILTSTEIASRQVTAIQKVVPEFLHNQSPKDRMAWGEWHIHSHL
jgi:SAM-dependent methyltransferase